MGHDTVSRSDIARLIPHQGTMCLLDRVQSWDAEHIGCAAISHRDPENPLRCDGILPCLAGIEYAAQAMALHGCLAGTVGPSEKGGPRAGFLASVRDVKCHAPSLDNLADTLFITATQLLGSEDRVIYQFMLTSDDKEVISGRAAVMLQA
jgi:predicted hotdog family 3-hydroxylacyl-ACP dehydratase